MEAIADVANSKRCQRLDENLVYYYSHYTGNQQSCLQENYVRNAGIYNKLMLYETRALQQAYAAQTVLR